MLAHTASAGSLAGVSILRSAVKSEHIDLSNLIATKPGSPVFIEKANEIGVELTDFMAAFCKSMGIDPKSGWNHTVPEDHQPLKPAVDLVREFEKPFVELMDTQKLRFELRPFAGGLSAIKLIKMGSKVLNPDIGKAIALTATVASSKTIPST